MERWLADTSARVLDEGGKVVGTLGMLQDITERKQMEEEIRRVHNLESLGVLAGSIAHDFNNVLTGVTGNLALLERLLDKRSEEYEIAVDARKSADRTRDLTSQLMTFARGGAPVKETASIEVLIRTKSSGHGLGLSISYSIIQRHGGHITVSSEAGVGTRFDFYLPASEEQTEEVTERERSLARGTGRILLMDDEKVIHKAVGRFLKHLGYEVESVYDGAEALKAYQASMEAGSPYDVVIMDLTIPGGMGGREAVRRLLEMHPEAKVIVASGYANDPVLASPEDYGFRGRIRKPVDLDDLVETVQRVLGMSGTDFG